MLEPLSSTPVCSEPATAKPSCVNCSTDGILSSSMFVSMNSDSCPLYVGSALLADTRTEYVMSPSTSPSSTPATTTCSGFSHSSGGIVKCTGKTTLPSCTLLLSTYRDTTSFGRLVSAIVNTKFLPDSDVVCSSGSDTFSVGISSSAVTHEIEAGMLR